MKLNLIRFLFAVEIPENIFCREFSLFSFFQCPGYPCQLPASWKKGFCETDSLLEQEVQKLPVSYAARGSHGKLVKWHDSESYLKLWKYELQPENYLCLGCKVFHLLHWNSQTAYSSCLYTAEDNKGENKSINAKTSLIITVIRATQALLMSRNERHKKTNLWRCNYKFSGLNLSS